MSILWTVVRVVLILLALATLVVTPFFVSGPSGTTVDPTGALIDLVALAVILASAWSLWRDRRRPVSP